MKKIIISSVLLAFTVVTFCQRTENHTKESRIKKFYLQVGAGGGTSNGISFDFGIQAVLKNNWTAGISYKLVEMNPKNLPDNYERGFTLAIFFPLYDEFPYNEMDVFSLTVGKYFETGRKTWFTTEAGLSFVNGQQFKFTSQPVTSDGWHESSNYSVQKENKTGFGVMLKTDFNWAILPYVGLGAGVFASLNSVQSPLGFELKFICGNLRKHKKK
jgi:hypothetical protein